MKSQLKVTDSNKMYQPGVELTLALLLITVREITSSAPTYQWTDETGATVTCQQCAPGTFVAKHCTSKSATECQPCPDQHYTQYWNYLDKCRFCNVICQDGERMEHECTATRNRVCECQPGYHHLAHFCIKDPDCRPHSGLLDKDDPSCDRAVIDFMVSQNMTHHNFRRLLRSVTQLDEKKPVKHKKIRSLLRTLRDIDPNHPPLQLLLDILNQAKLHNVERNLRRRFSRLEQL